MVVNTTCVYLSHHVRDGLEKWSHDEKDEHKL